MRDAILKKGLRFVCYRGLSSLDPIGFSIAVAAS